MTPVISDILLLHFYLLTPLHRPWSLARWFFASFKINKTCEWCQAGLICGFWPCKYLWRPCWPKRWKEWASMTARQWSTGHHDEIKQCRPALQLCCSLMRRHWEMMCCEPTTGQQLPCVTAVTALCNAHEHTHTHTHTIIFFRLLLNQPIFCYRAL